MKTMRRYITIIIGFVLFIFIGTSCNNYLDVVPDNIPTIDHAFNKRYQAEGFLYGCYGFLPNHANPADNPAFLAGDEAWLFDQFQAVNPRMWLIAKGEQGTDSPIANFWSSEQEGYGLKGGKPLFTGIRDCNIFLENIHKPVDLEEWEMKQWIAEAKVLKAYFHFWLLRMYGPVPVIDENVPLGADVEESKLHREPVDSVFNYIGNLLDEASLDLPLQIEDITNDLGRITKPAALALKAQVMVYAASPLFNGNTDYAGMVDNRGKVLFPQTYESKKWSRAVEALKEAIDVCHQAGHKLYDFTATGLTSNLSPQTVSAMQVRGALTDRWNPEIIWANSKSNTNTLQDFCFPPFRDENLAGGSLYMSYAPTLRVVEQFYTKNGVPIEEDKDWTETDLYGLRNGDEEHKFYIKENYKTINLHFNREARFYGALSFDGGTFFGNGNIAKDEDLNITQFKYGIFRFKYDRYSSTGYLVKKVIPWQTSITETGTSPTKYRYAFPIIRLADLYLMYAEALNEMKDVPDGEVYEYIDLVRERTGLKSVVESWADHAVDPQKPLIKEGMRNIIRRERMNELAFEGNRFWDLRRWKLAEEYLNTPIRGLDVFEAETEDFYQIRNIFFPVFEKKDYLWPIRQSVLSKNSNLIQNPGW